MTRQAAKPYSLAEAAAVIGMSKFWLRDRLKDTQSIRDTAFRTRGDRGHWRFQVAAFDRVADRYKAGRDLGRSIPARRNPKPSSPTKAPGRTKTLMQIYRESRAV